MKTKLELAKERRKHKQKQADQIDKLVSELQAFHDKFNPKVELDLTELQKQLTELPVLLSQPITQSLEGFLAQLETRLEKEKQPDLSKLIKEITIDNQIDLEPIRKEISELKALADKKEVKQSQLASDYLPYRRVVKLGSRFFFDDNMTSSGGGGGIDTSGLATTAKQDDIKNQIALKAGTDYDYTSFTNSDTDEDTIVYKTGGSGGTTVQTVVITYASGADKFSDVLSELSYS